MRRRLMIRVLEAEVKTLKAKLKASERENQRIKECRSKQIDEILLGTEEIKKRIMANKELVRLKAPFLYDRMYR